MVYKRVLPFCIAVLIALFSCGCGKTDTVETNVNAAGTTAAEIPEAPVTIGVGAPVPDGLDAPEFDSETAERLGRITSDIYGKLAFYYQDGFIYIFNSDRDLLFTLDACGYSPNYQETPVELHGDDVNFDGHTDFYLLENRTSQGDYCFFWLWNKTTRTFEYYVALSSFPSPVIDAVNRTIVTTEILNADQLLRTVYRWQGGNITAVSNDKVSTHPQQEDEEDELLPGMKPEVADTRVLIQDGHVLSSVLLYVNENTHSRWICTIEDPNVVALYEDELNNENLTHTFTFKGVSPGVTTVVFRYSTGWDDTFISQKILNIQVGTDRLLRIIETG